MSVRTRTLLAALLTALLPLTVFALGARREVQRRMEAQYRARLAATSMVIRADLARQATVIDARLGAMAEAIQNDGALRAALLDRADRSVLLDYAAPAMRAAGLEYLLLLDESGNVVSSGHFRNEYDRRMSGLAALTRAQGPVLLAARRPQGTFLALARARSFALGERQFALAGGTQVDSGFLRSLARDADSLVVVGLEYPGDTLYSGAAAIARPDARALSEAITLPFIDDVGDATADGQARWSITHSLQPLQRVQRALDLWLLAALAAAALLAVLAARLLSARVTQPLEELAGKTERLSLDRLNVDFATDRADEIGSLSRLLDAMVKRLRTNVAQLRAAERRATVGEMARQVNHDIRNGLLPIRNVIQHLGEVARDTPDELRTVFREREGTLKSGIGYLESLAANYARLTPRSERRACDLNAIIRTALQSLDSGAQARIRTELAQAAPRVNGDPIALRRIIDNLTVNALQSLENGAGTVTVSTELQRGSGTGRVLIGVRDTGSGIAPDALDRIFDDFYTTKPAGSGLGLSIVRRLVADLGGRIRVQSERGQGTTFHVELPEAP